MHNKLNTSHWQLEIPYSHIKTAIFQPAETGIVEGKPN